jgi:hypothetical protein
VLSENPGERNLESHAFGTQAANMTVSLIGFRSNPPTKAFVPFGKEEKKTHIELHDLAFWRTTPSRHDALAEGFW